MLRLKSIKKDYIVADTKVHALKGIDLSFRKNEFVSILGPSGCGKTTLLNIIGGLDKYSEGDLFINGRSTKEFNDRDWDVYRNHRIGFIFQSYNLIPHQTILGNVELALTISGVGKAERQERAKKALDKVGLAGQYNKKPNQLSGGQCQRVAIARALVNEPEILLADEPTGALDTVTSVQIMDLIKEIAQEKLVIMVTHNPELAEKYSTRIVKLLDGELLDDSNPFTEEEEVKEIADLEAIEKEKEEKELALIDPSDTKALKDYDKNKNAKEKAKMSMWTAFKLSAKNLYSKLKRTILVVIAGSIGIIGVSAVLSVSTGVHDYIDNMQDDMLSGNPIQITKTAIDYNALLNSSSLAQKKEALDKGDWVNVNSIIDYLVTHEDVLKDLVHNNELTMDYINYLKNMPKEYYQEIKMNYGIDATTNIYTDFNVFKKDEASLELHSEDDKALAEKYSRKLSLNAITETYTAMLEKTPYSQYSSYITSLATVMNQGVSNNEYIASQYDVLWGDVNNFGKNNPHGVVIVLSKNKELSDLLLAQLGYFTEDEFYNMIFKAAPDDLPGEYHEELNRTRFTYDELSNKKFYWYPNDTIYKNNSQSISGIFAHMYPYEQEAKADWTDGVELSIAAIVRPKDTVSYGSLQSGFIYSEEFAREMIAKNINSAIAKNIQEHGSVSSVEYPVGSMKLDLGINYTLNFTYYDTFEKVYKEGSKKIFVGKNQSGIMSTFMSYIGQGSGMSGIGGTGSGSGSESSSGTGITDMLAKLKTMDLNGVGGTYIPESISIYPNDFESKHLVTDYLDAWNDSSKTVKITGLDNDFKPNGKVSYRYAGLYSLADKEFSEYVTDTKFYKLEYKPIAFSDEKKYESNVYFTKDNDGKYVLAEDQKQNSNVQYYEADFTEVTFTEENPYEANTYYVKVGSIKYTDSVEIIINLINTMINIITYALIAFTALSLVVSTVMIAIITYVSVVERVKEIGVIRSLGGRKKDVSHLFNAETFVIGLASGIFGVLVTGILSLLANLIVSVASSGAVTSIAHLTWANIGIMIALSILLTLIAGLLPARSAAKKDPVVALRTE